MAAPPKTLWSVILAAGGSRRLGSPKQFVRRHSLPLLLHTVDAATTTTPGRVVVVVGAHALRLRSTIARHDRSIVVVANPRWEEGMSTSLIRGLSALPESARAALLMLTDQPDVTPRSLRTLVEAWRGRQERPAASVYRRQAGVPAILPRRYWHCTRGLEGDVGARPILRAAGEKLTTVAMPEAALDIDTEQDLAKL